MKKIFFVFLNTLFLLCASNQLYSQIIEEGEYNGTNFKYEKNLIQCGLNIDSINNTTYMANVNNFLTSINAKIDTIYLISKIPDSSGTYVMTIIKLLRETMDALFYIPIIQKGGFFHYLQPCQVIEVWD
ncbi:MAG: hypothetical protein WAT71_09245 [Ignavibacteria bacterium]